MRTGRSLAVLALGLVVALVPLLGASPPDPRGVEGVLESGVLEHAKAPPPAGMAWIAGGPGAVDARPWPAALPLPGAREGGGSSGPGLDVLAGRAPPPG
jgi:hypothetical protein